MLTLFLIDMFFVFILRILFIALKMTLKLFFHILPFVWVYSLIRMFFEEEE